jgi:hypothetical protein
MHIKKNQMIIGAVAGVVLLGASFWGGMAYARGHMARGNFAQFGQGGMGGQFAGRGGAASARGMAGGVAAGEIIAKDAASITVKMANGSTRIILMGSSTPVTKQASGTQDDLSVGTQVAVTGSSNSDGSMTANTVQIRPAGAGAPMPRQ